MNKGARILFLTVIAVVGIIVLMNAVGNPASLPFGAPGPKELQTGEFKKYVREQGILTAKWQQNSMTGEMTNSQKYTARVPAPDSNGGAELSQLMDANGVKYNIEEPPASQAIMPILSLFVVPVLVMVLIWLFLIRPAQAGGNQAMSFGRSKAKRAGELSTKVTFDDVAGVDEAKQELFEVVDFLRNTKRYVALGAKIPKGILLTGPPGVGKTHLARAIAGEAGVPFFHISGSDFVEMFVGVGAARVRDMFETAKAHRPCLLFVDEIDAVGRQRGTGLGGGHDEREQTLNQLLVEMDGFEVNAGVIVIAATNRPDVLDPALRRPGRFDRHIVIDRPDMRGRELILRIHAKGKPLASDVDLRTIAKRAPGFTGADLANSLNEAALLAARRNLTQIGMAEVEEALDRVMMGPQRKSSVIEQQEREVIAYHESGHALVGELLEHCDPVHKVTILPRGWALGLTWSLPEKDMHLQSKQQLLDQISMSLGGLVSEQIVFDTQFTGTTSDLEHVTRLARAMVTEYGMSDKVGTRAIGRRHVDPFLGREMVEDRDYSEEVAKLVDSEVHDIVQRCRERAFDVLTTHRDKLDELVQALLERESLNREEFLAVLEGRPLPESQTNGEASSGETPEPLPSAASGDGSSVPPTLEPGPA